MSVFFLLYQAAAAFGASNLEILQALTMASKPISTPWAEQCRLPCRSANTLLLTLPLWSVRKTTSGFAGGWVGEMWSNSAGTPFCFQTMARDLAANPDVKLKSINGVCGNHGFFNLVSWGGGDDRKALRIEWSQRGVFAHIFPFLLGLI